MFFQASLGIQLALLGISFLGTIVAGDVGGIERADYANHTPACMDKLCQGLKLKRHSHT